MEIIILIMLYYLSQNPNFPESMKPLMGSLKNSEEMLRFLNDLSKFSELFATIKPTEKGDEKKDSTKKEGEKSEKKTEEKKENATAPTNGIADAFIKECLENYFKKR